MLRAANDAPLISAAPPASATAVPAPTVTPTNAEPAGAESGGSDGVPAAAPLKVSVAANDLQIHVEAPFVFHATGPPPAPVEDVRALPLASRPVQAVVASSPLPPAHAHKPSGPEMASAETPSRRGFFGKLRGFFASMFR